MTLESLVSDGQAIKCFDSFFCISVFFIFKKAVSFGNVALFNQIKKLKFAKSLTNFSDLLIHECQWQTTQINLIIFSGLP